jgi:hypothetical protein
VAWSAEATQQCVDAFVAAYAEEEVFGLDRRVLGSGEVAEIAEEGFKGYLVGVRVAVEGGDGSAGGGGGGGGGRKRRTVGIFISI